MYTILHISDLHRSPTDPITNAELLSALLADRDRYTTEDPRVPAPDAIVVSGDVIQGVELGIADFADQLTEQYQVADEFLAGLTTRFLGGDRSRVIIVPGNHDVDWNTALSAMESVVDVNAPQDLARVLFREDSQYRWNWQKRELYRIANPAGYERRLDAYWNFLDEFYSGVPNLLRVKHGAPAQLFSLFDGKVGVAAFNSCHGNDCFAFHGNIPREVVAQAHLDLIAPPLAFDVRIAVWHHSIEGPPYRTDYMDVDIVKGMVGRGFRLGLYGHQHRAQAARTEIRMPDRETMAVVSAGSLCAGAGKLPMGVHRQYNVIEVADDFRSARVHVREMVASNLFGRASLNIFGGASHETLRWEPPKDLAGRPVIADDARLRSTIEQAEVALKAGQAEASARLLTPLQAVLDGHGRRLLVEAAIRAGNWGLLLAVTSPPRSIRELVARVQACLKVNDYRGARASLDRFARDLNLDVATERDLRSRVAAEEAIHR